MGSENFHEQHEPKPKESTEVAKPLPGVPVDALDTSKTDTSKEKKEELTSEEKLKCGKFRHEMVKKLANLDMKDLSPEDIKKKIKKTVGTLPPEIVKYVKPNFKHLYSFDNGTYLTEVNMKWVSDGKAELKTECYEKSSFDEGGEHPDNKSDVPKLKQWLEFKSEAIQLLKGVKTEEDMNEKLKSNGDGTGLEDLIEKKGLTEALGGEKPAKWAANNVVSFSFADKVVEVNIKCPKGEPAYIFLITHTSSGTTYSKFEEKKS